MQRALTARIKFGKSRLNSFTLVELLVVIAIIGILMAITLAAASGVMAMAARSRAHGEIQAMSTALESYKNDNGAYPMTNTMNTNASPSYTSVDGTSANYIQASQLLYESLSGKNNFLDPPTSGIKAYESFKIGQVGNAKAPANSGIASTSSYLQDPWGYSYGYNTGTGNGGATTNYPYNGAGFFDLWSTAGATTSSPNGALTNTAAWISNWQ